VRIVMIGAGYTGLVAGACLADFGHDVTCIDSDAARIAALIAGRIPIFEPGLEPMVAANRQSGRLTFGTGMALPIAQADVVFIAVGTPAGADGRPDVTAVTAAARAIAPHLKGFTVVATKSTVPVGTGDAIEALLRETNPSADVAVVSNPEFLREGAAVNDFKLPNRIIIGTEDDRARHVMNEVYRPLYLNQSPVFFTTRRTAELTKYAANAYLAMKITFINEIADLCEAVGGDVQDVARGIGLDNRIGPKFLHPGPGFGGSCLPKDTLAIARLAEDSGAPLRLIEATVALNSARKREMAARVIAACGGDVAGKTVALLGLTFKPNTDDMREAPSLVIAAELEKAGARLRAFDPQGMEHARALLPGVTMCADAYDCARGADALVLITEWESFRALDAARLRAVMKNAVLVDLRNVYPPAEMRAGGFTYRSIGRTVRDRDEASADGHGLRRRATDT
jgi:UDPglucose 6-dehydrogenase